MGNVDAEEIKVIIKSIVISSPVPISIPKLMRDFQGSEGRDIPFPALGYRNIVDYLHSLRDVIEVLPDNTVKALKSRETQHIQDLISRQRKPKKRSGTGNRFRDRPTRYPLNSYTHTQFNRQRAVRSWNQSGAFSLNRSSSSSYHPPNRWTTQQSSYQTPNRNSNYNYTTIPERGVSLGRPQSADDSSYTSEDSFEIVSGNPEKQTKENKADGINGYADTQRPPVTVTRNDVSSSVPVRIRNNLRELIKDYSSGLLCSRLSDLYKEKFKESFDCRNFGFASVIQLVDTLPDIFKIVKKDNHDYLLYDAQRSSEVVLESKQIRDGSLPNRVCERIVEIAKTLDSPTNFVQFDKVYQTAFGVSLYSEVRGYSSLESVFNSIDKSLIQLGTEDGTVVVLPAKRNQFEAALMTPGSILYPTDMLRVGEKIPRLELFSDCIIPCMEVELAEIYTPHKFFMTLHNPKDFNKYFQQFYAESSHLSLEDVIIKPQLYCAAPYIDQWHRAIITKVCSSTHAVVFLIDFGTQLTLPKTALRFLHRDFATIPWQAIKAELHTVEPIAGQDKFSKEANHLFFELAANRNLRAYLKGINFMELTVLVRLVAVEGDKEIAIDEQLVDKGVAVFKNKTLNTSVTSTEPHQPLNESKSSTSDVTSPSSSARGKTSIEQKLKALCLSNVLGKRTETISSKDNHNIPKESMTISLSEKTCVAPTRSVVNQKSIEEEPKPICSNRVYQGDNQSNDKNVTTDSRNQKELCSAEHSGEEGKRLGLFLRYASSSSKSPTTNYSNEKKSEETVGNTEKAVCTNEPSVVNKPLDSLLRYVLTLSKPRSN